MIGKAAYHAQILECFGYRFDNTPNPGTYKRSYRGDGFTSCLPTSAEASASQAVGGSYPKWDVTPTRMDLVIQAAGDRKGRG